MADFWSSDDRLLLFGKRRSVHRQIVQLYIEMSVVLVLETSERILIDVAPRVGYGPRS